MKARCRECSTAYEFRMERGAKLSDRKCKCGGSFERLLFARPFNAIGTGVYVDSNGIEYLWQYGWPKFLERQMSVRHGI